mgnify:CR=1 FL=1
MNLIQQYKHKLNEKHGSPVAKISLLKLLLLLSPTLIVGTKKGYILYIFSENQLQCLL